jgi:hypothetical protein
MSRRHYHCRRCGRHYNSTSSGWVLSKLKRRLGWTDAQIRGICHRCLEKELDG